jgi:phosphohistidine phosphatase SixA
LFVETERDCFLAFSERAGSLPAAKGHYSYSMLRPLRERDQSLFPRTMRTLSITTAALLVAGCVHASSSPRAQATPRDGTELVTRMHDRYAGRWYNTVTFTQTTTQQLPNGTERVSTWHEALRAPGILRIDVGAPADGNVVIYTRDSSYRVRAGKLVRAEPDANPFMPFVVTMYHVPVAETLGELARWKFDLSRVRADTLDGRPTWVVGAADAADTTSPQFWVDAERLVATRIILAPEAMAPAMDIILGGYQPLGGGWIATDVDIRMGGKSVQREQYADLRANVDLAPSMFDPHQWPVGAPPAPASGPSMPPNTTVILVRHAEKIDDSSDPALSAAGSARAIVLADSLAHAGISGIIVTQLQRTRLTAQPLATRLGLEPVVVPAGAPGVDHAAAVAALIRDRFAGKTVLVVGHSNTVPTIIHALGIGDPVTIADSEYDAMFTVRTDAGGRPTLERSRFGAASAAR